MLDHVGLRVSDLERSKRFFEEALFPLGYEPRMEHYISGTGFGRAGKPLLWIKQGVPSASVHIAFASSGRASVDAFYDAAIVAVPLNLLRRLRPRSRQQQHRSGLPQAGSLEAGQCRCSAKKGAAQVVFVLVNPDGLSTARRVPPKAAKMRSMVAGLGCYPKKVVKDVTISRPASLVENILATYPRMPLTPPQLRNRLRRGIELV